MTPPMEIQSLSNARAKRLVRLRKSRIRRSEGVLIAEGAREVGRARDAGLVPLELWYCHGLWQSNGSPAEETADWGGENQVESRFFDWAPPHVSEIHASEAVFRKVAYHRDPEGILGVFEAPKHTLDTLQLDRGRLLVAVGTEKPGNLGAMVRSAAAAGCDGVLAVGAAVDVFNPNAIRNSTGAVFQMPVVEVETDDEAVAWLHNQDIRVAAALAEGGTSCFDANMVARATAPLAVVVGPEHAGLGAMWRDAADVAITIPTVTHGVVDSLNASVAAGVLLFEMLRQSEGAAS
ncbi:MAG: TrmH family RNA methyltransferase [Algisphaera sp.]